MSGFVGDLSQQQEATLQKFKTALADIPNKPDDTDYFYLRWLRARKFDQQKAEVMFRNHMEYRKKYGADTILHDYTPPKLFAECLSGGYFGEDLDGHPVWYDHLGNNDPRGVYRSITSVEEAVKFKCLHHEQLDVLCKQQSEKYGKHIETIALVLDFKNLSFQKHYYWPAIEMFKEILALEEAHCPERTKVILVINTPSIFPFCYNIVKHVLDERTRKKIIVFKSNCNLKEELQKYISLDELPAMFGGNRYEPDAECSKYINIGCDVPPKYYLTNNTETNKDNMERVLVGGRSSHKVCHDVADVGSTLQWEFFSTDYDISFGVYVKGEESGRKEKLVICPMTRTESQRFPQTGHHCCQVPGKYVLKFDNSYSWTRSKEVFYSIKLLSPNVEPETLLVAEVNRASMRTPSPSSIGEDEFFECSEAVAATSS